jgi:hypothetical protein
MNDITIYILNRNTNNWNINEKIKKQTPEPITKEELEITVKTSKNKMVFHPQVQYQQQKKINNKKTYKKRISLKEKEKLEDIKYIENLLNIDTNSSQQSSYINNFKDNNDKNNNNKNNDNKHYNNNNKNEKYKNINNDIENNNISNKKRKITKSSEKEIDNISSLCEEFTTLKELQEYCRDRFTTLFDKLEEIQQQIVIIFLLSLLLLIIILCLLLFLLFNY